MFRFSGFYSRGPMTDYISEPRGPCLEGSYCPQTLRGFRVYVVSFCTAAPLLGYTGAMWGNSEADMGRCSGDYPYVVLSC